MTPTYVYFLRDGEHVKIGSSVHPFERRKQSGLEHARFLFGLFVPLPAQGHWIEGALHRHFSSKQLIRVLYGIRQIEWFSLTSTDLDSIKQLKFWHDEPHNSTFCECHPFHHKWASLDIPCRKRRIYIGFARPLEVGI